MLSNWFKWLIRRLLIKNTTQNEILEIEIREHQGSEKVSTMKQAYEYYRNQYSKEKSRCGLADELKD